MSTLNAKVLHVNKTTAEWAAETTVISKGLLCIEFTSDGKVKAKVGDGVNNYAELPFLSDGSINVADYYTSTQTDTAISTAISNLGNIFTFKGIKSSTSNLPTSGNKIGDVWLVGTEASSGDSFEEYIWTSNNKWEYIGKKQIEIDLSGYATTANLTAHTGNKSNPHGVTKSQVGLGNVENKSSATIRSELTKANVTTALGYTPPTTDTTYNDATTTASGLMSSADKTKLNATNVAYATCNTAAETAAKVITISNNDNWKLAEGSMIVVLFSETNTAQNPTFNVNNTGAKSVKYGTAVVTTSNLNKAGYASRYYTYMYNGTEFVYVSSSVDDNTTYSNASLGQGYATCTTAAATAAKVASLSSYALITGGIVAVKFSYDVPASATLNVNSKGAKAIYYKGKAITAGIIKAGDIATFIYSSQYHLIAIDAAPVRADETLILNCSL